MLFSLAEGASIFIVFLVPSIIATQSRKKFLGHLREMWERGYNEKIRTKESVERTKDKLKKKNFSEEG